MANLGSDNTPVKGKNFSLPAGAQIDEDGGDLVVRDSGGSIVLRRDETAGAWDFVSDDLTGIASLETDEAIVEESLTLNSDKIQLGSNSNAGDNAVSVGVDTDADSNSVGIGREANADFNSVAVGRGADTENDSVAIGRSANVQGRQSVGIGEQVTVSVDNAVAVGDNTETKTPNVARIGANQLVFGGNDGGTIADADLNTGELTVEFDEANTQIVIRGKDSDGTIQTATIGY